MPALPEGVVTFLFTLFTDVEGSTRLAHELGDAGWAELLAAYQWLVRRAFEAHEGVEVDTQGDAFFAVFARASDAVAAAVAAQRALDGHPWPGDRPVRVRIGLHTGEALLRDGQYVGQEVHRASRICGAAHGGQIVLSRTTADLVHEGLPAGATLDDLGEHRLKDLADAQRLFGVVEQLRGRPERAGRLLAAARHLGGAADLAIPFRSPASWALYRHYLPIVRAALGPQNARRARNEGRAMTLDEALRYALAGLG